MLSLDIYTLEVKDSRKGSSDLEASMLGTQGMSVILLRSEDRRKTPSPSLQSTSQRSSFFQGRDCQTFNRLDEAPASQPHYRDQLALCKC